MKKTITCALAAVSVAALAADNTKFADWKTRIPRPIYDERPELVDFYDKAWEIAHTRIDHLPGIPVPRYMDEGHRSDWIWIWDTCFMVHFTKYASFEFPGVESLGNFYGLMFPEGALTLPKVIGNRWSYGPDGVEKWEGKLLDFKLAHPDNPPLFAWTEYRHALQTGDGSRLAEVYSKKRLLQRWYELFESFTPADPPRKGVLSTPDLRREGDLGYHWAGGKSGMDNTPRGRKGERDLGPKSPVDCPDNPDLLWIDAYAQQALAALSISRIAELLGDIEGSAQWRAKYAAKKAKINELYWDEEDGFYYDILASDRTKCKVPTIASYWALLAEVPSPRQRARLIEKLKDPQWFGGDIPMPSLARKDADFWPTGGYWRGGVWMPTSYMTLKGLDRFGEYELARDLATRLVGAMCDTWKEYEPHTIWEAYSPTEKKPATYAKVKGVTARPDFCGWSALGPISIFIEDIIGIKEANAFLNMLTCEFAREIKGRVGVTNYRFGKVTCSIVATTEKIEVETDRAFLLRANGREYAVRPGKNVFDRRTKETVVIVPCHPDDLVSALGFCLKAHDQFDIHVVDFTHGERGLGEKGLADGSTKKIRMAEEQSVCDAAGVKKLHWLDEIDGEAYACRETCEKLAEILKDVNPRAVIGHFPSDIHTDHVMAGAAMLRAVFLSGLKPEVYFFNQVYQTKGFVPDCLLDVSDVFEKKSELIRLYKCQYRDGGIERRQRMMDTVAGMSSQMLAFGKTEAYKSLFPRTQGECRIFDELDAIPALLGERKFQGVR